MRRLFLACLVLLVGMAGVFVYNGLAREREIQRLIADGDRASAGGQPLLAIEAYSGALALDPQSMAVHLKRGETYQRQADLRNARRDLTVAARLDPTAPRPLERLGDVSIALEEHGTAIEHYTQYVRLDDQNTRVLYKLALAYVRDGRINRAVPLLRRAMALDPDFTEAHYLLGLCLREQDRLEEARESLARVVELSPGFLPARDVLASVHATLGEHREQLQQLDALAALDRAHPERQVDRGLAYARAGQTDLAVLALVRAAEDHSDQTQIYAALGQVWMEIAETRADYEALSKALDALRSVPPARASSETLTLLGRAYLLDGDLVEARRVLAEAIVRFPVDPTAFLHLAWLEEDERNWDEVARLRRSHRLLTQPSPAVNASSAAPSG